MSEHFWSPLKGLCTEILQCPCYGYTQCSNEFLEQGGWSVLESSFLTFKTHPCFVCPPCVPACVLLACQLSYAHSVVSRALDTLWAPHELSNLNTYQISSWKWKGTMYIEFLCIIFNCRAISTCLCLYRWCMNSCDNDFVHG